MKQSFTLTEILVGTVLLVTIFAVLMGSFVSLREYVNRADARLEAANEARGMLNGLYQQVTAANWLPGGPGAGSAFSNGCHPNCTDPNYYNVPAAQITGYRQVDITINYNP